MGEQRFYSLTGGRFKRTTIPRVDPSLCGGFKVHSAQMRCEPNLLHGRLNVNHDLSAAFEFDRKNVAAARAVSILIIVLNKVLQTVYFRICSFQNSVSVIDSLTMTPTHLKTRRTTGNQRSIRAKAARTVVLAAAAVQIMLALSGCGLKGDLYMPNDEPMPTAPSHSPEMAR